MLRITHCLLIAFFVVLFSALAAGQVASISQGFIQNKGQITDQCGNPNDHVIAAYFNDYLDFIINRDGFSYQLKTPLIPSVFETAGESNAFSCHRVDISLENMSPDFSIEFFGELPGEEQFINQHGFFSSVKKYSGIVLKSVYSRIDLEFLIDNESEYPVKYNFIVHDLGVIADIRMKYSGQESLGITDETFGNGGEVSVKTSIGELREDIPLSYWMDEERINAVAVRYVNVGPDAIGYELNPQHSIPQGKTLVIDPTPQVNWATYFGGTGIDQANVVKLDGFGFVYLAGNTNSSSGIATSGAYQTTFGGGAGNDIFISKFDLNGSRIWTTYFGGAGEEQIYGLATDASANIYFTGSSTSTSGIATLGAYQTTPGGQSDLIVGKFNTTGSLQWCSYLGGTQNDIGYGIQILGSNVFVVGTATSTTGIASVGASQTSYGGGTSDGVICRFSDTGIFSWSTYFGSSGNDILRGLDINSSGNLVVAGYTTGNAGLTTAGVHQTAFAGVNDGLVATYTSTGNKVWCSYFGGSLSDLCLSVAVNSSDEIVLCGYTYSSAGVATAGAYDVSAAGAGDVFINVFSSVGTRMWGTYYGGTGTDIGSAIFIDAVDNIFISGNTNSAGSIASPGAQQTSFGGGIADGFFAQFNTAGTLNWGTYLGGSGDDYLRGVDVDAVTGAYTAGFSNSSSGISTTGSHQTSIASASSDGILVKYNNLSFLPINIISFSATPSENQEAVECNWKVASESSCQGYVLDRSADGSTWSLLDELGCTGFDSIYEYQVLDESPDMGINYYRISQLDFQGNVVDSKVAVVMLQQDPDDLLLYPIPAGNYLNMMVNSRDDQFCTLNVFDLYGKLLMSSPLSFIRGSNYLGIETASLPHGHYIVQLVSPDGTFTQKKFTK